MTTETRFIDLVNDLILTTQDETIRATHARIEARQTARTTLLAEIARLEREASAQNEARIKLLEELAEQRTGLLVALAQASADRTKLTLELGVERAECDQRDERIRALEAALRKLTNEVHGTLGAFEAGMRQEIGNTQVACLKLRADEARALL